MGVWIVPPTSPLSPSEFMASPAIREARDPRSLAVKLHEDGGGVRNARGGENYLWRRLEMCLGVGRSWWTASSDGTGAGATSLGMEAWVPKDAQGALSLTWGEALVALALRIQLALSGMTGRLEWVLGSLVLLGQACTRSQVAGQGREVVVG